MTHLLWNGRPARITIDPPVSGGGGSSGGSGSTSLPVALSLANQKATAIPAGAPATFGHFFAPGDVPAGSRVKVGSLAVQQDAETCWPDGSLRFTALTVQAEATPAAGGSNTYSVSADPTAPSRTPAFTAVALAAVSDFKALFTGFDCGSETFSLSFNDVLSTGTAEPWEAVVTLTGAAASGATSLSVSDASHISVGQAVSADGKTDGGTWPIVTAISGTTITISPGLSASVASGGTLHFTHPLCGWKPIKAGPLCMGWEFWSYLRVVGGANAGKYHCQVKATGYLHAFGLHGPYELYVEVENSNIYGKHPSATMGPTSAVTAKRFVSKITVQSGTTVMGVFGGASDPRTVSVPAANFNASTGVVTGVTLESGTPCFVTSSGSLPTGLSSASPYWFIGDATTGYLCTDRTSVYGGVQSNPATFTGAGSGTITLAPLMGVYPQNAIILASVTAEPLWDPGTSGVAVRPHVLPGHDRTYLAKTGAVPNYDWTVPTTPRTSYQITDRRVVADLTSFYAGQAQPWGSSWSISEFGDDPGDERVGFLTNIGVDVMYHPTNPYGDQMARIAALRFADYVFNLTNERSGQPLAYNNGPAKNGTQYPGLGPVDYRTVTMNTPSAYPFQGNAAFSAPDASGFFNKYGPAVDESHMPLAGFVPYMRTGHSIYLRQMKKLCGAILSTIYDQVVTINGNSYYFSLVATDTSQMRGLAWRLRTIAQAELVCPSSDPYAAFLRDQMDEGSAYLLDFLAAGPTPSQYATLGLYNIAGSNNQLCLYQYTYLAFVVGLIAKRETPFNRRLGYRNFLRDYASKALITLMDSDAGGGFYIGADGADGTAPGQYPFPGNVLHASNTNDQTTAYQTPAALWANPLNGGLSSPQPSGFRDGLFGGSGAYPFDTTSYFISHAAALGQMADLGVPNAAKLLARMRAAATTSPYAGVDWGEVSNSHYDMGTPQNYLVWAVAPSGGTVIPKVS